MGEIEEKERLAALGRKLDAAEAELEERLARARRRSGWFMNARVASFAGSFVSFLIAGFRSEPLFGWFGMIPLAVVFVLLVIWHIPTRREVARLERLLRLVLAKRSRLASPRRPAHSEPALRAPSEHATARLRGRTSRGGAFALPDYVLDDLALYSGAATVFSLLCSASSRLGTLQLARWLSTSSIDAAEITQRQDAAKELLASVRLREKLEQELATNRGAPHDDSLAFLESGDVTLERVGALRYAPLVFAALFSLVLASLVFSSGGFFVAAVILAEIGNFVFRDAVSRTAEIRNSISGFRPLLATLARARTLLGESGLTSPRLRDIEERLAALTDDERDPPGRILRSLAFLGIYRAGLLYVVFNRVTLYDLVFIPPLCDSWNKSRERLATALGALGELEALISLANVAEEQPAWCWPQVVEEPAPRLEIEAGRHPLLTWEAAVPSSVALGDGRGVRVITGSNMAGKSTFLRMCGTNLVVAQTGGPVPADGMRWTPMPLLTDINVRDSLDDGQSYFSVEVGRVRSILARAEESPFLLALLDEIFRGTNTHEKVAAGVEVTLFLARQGALALVATHDHEFTFLERDEPGVGIRNYHFSEEIEDGAMVFSYRLHEGAARSSNAIRLLEIRDYPAALVAGARARAHQGASAGDTDPKEPE